MVDSSDLSKDGGNPQPAPGKDRETAQSLSKIWKKTGLNKKTCLLMFKASVAPTIGIAIYQSTTVANFFTTNGFIIPLISFVSLPILPRMRFIQGAFCIAFAICLAASLTLLALWCAFQARMHTSSIHDKSYNSSQAAVLAVWLTFNMYWANTVKSILPWLQVPVWMFCIFNIVILTAAVKFTSMTAAIKVVKTLLETFLTGLGIGVGVSFIVFPANCRKVLFGSFQGQFQALNRLLDVQLATLDHLEQQNPWSPSPGTKKQQIAHCTAFKNLQGATAKLRGDQSFAEREVAIGKLDAADITSLVNGAASLIGPLSGLTFLFDLLGSQRHELSLSDDTSRETDLVEDWHRLLRPLQQSSGTLTVAMKEALEHILIILQLKKPSLQEKRVTTTTGTPEFLTWYDAQIREYLSLQEILAQPSAAPEAEEFGTKQDKSRKTGRARAPLILIYIFYLFHSTSRQLRSIVAFAESKHADGTLQSSGLIYPSHIFANWTRSQSSHQATTPPVKHHRLPRCDPDHLPPRNHLERTGNLIRRIPRFLRSTHSVHGLRVACAVMSLGIGFYLRSSSSWFLKYRFLWSLIAIILSMNRTAGSSTWAYLCRLVATAITMVAAYVIWYITDQKTAGVIVFLWLYLMGLAYLMIRFPPYIPAVVVGVFAAIIIVGDGLQNRKLGKERVEKLGQMVLPEYKLAPQRLAITAAGLAVAYFWTIFPYPLSEHTELRQDLGHMLYLLAGYNSMVKETIMGRTRRRAAGPETTQGDIDNMATLKKKHQTELQMSFAHLRQQLNMTKYQVILGGRYPQDKYAELIDLSERIDSALVVMDHAASSFSSDIIGQRHTETAEPEPAWLSSFAPLLPAFATVADQITHLLLTLSTHLSTPSPLSSNTLPIADFQLAKRMDEIDEDIWRVERLSEPGYAAFVTMTMASRGVLGALNRQIEITRELVGVLDFAVADEDADVEDQRPLTRAMEMDGE